MCEKNMKFLQILLPTPPETDIIGLLPDFPEENGTQFRHPGRDAVLLTRGGNHVSDSLSLYNCHSITDFDILVTRPEFAEMMTWYRCAIMEVETKFNVLNQEFSLQYDRNPFEAIKTRLKNPRSIQAKLERKGLDPSIENIQQNLHDIAGVRVVCSFQEDIYRLARMLGSQDDVSLLRIKDYIKNPKPNGYRSLHLIIAIPIFLSDTKKYMKVEVQFRTIAMDFWASLEHKLKYKKDVRDPEHIAQRLEQCARQIDSIDQEMQSIRHLIEKV